MHTGLGDASLFRSLFASLSDAVLVVDRRARVISVNPAFSDMFGYPGDLVTGSGAEVFFASKSEFERVLSELRERPAESRDLLRARFRRSSGEVFTGEMTVAAVDGAPGEPEAIMTIIRDLTNVEAVEAARRAAEERTRRMAESSFEALIITEGGTIVDANDAAARMFGFTLEETVGTHIIQFCAPEYIPTVAAAMTDDDAAPFEIEALRKDGIRFWVEVQNRSWREGNRTFRVTAIRDQTARRDMAHARERAEERWLGVLESLQDIYFEATLEDVLTFQSPSAERLYGRSTAEMLGTRTRDLYVDPSRHDEVVAILQSGHPVQDFEAEFKVRGGTVHVSINCKLVLGPDRMPIGTNGTVRDITARKAAEREIHESHQRYRQIVETANEGICLLAPDGTVEFVNPTLAAMLGYSPEEMLGRPTSDFVVPEWYAQRDQSRLSGWRTGQSEHYEGQYLRRDGSHLWALVAASPVDRPDGTRGALIMLTDITERRRTEQRLELHIRNAPLAVIQWDTDFCVAEWNPAAERMFGWTRDEAHGRHASELVISGRAREEIDTSWQLLLSSPEPLYQVNEHVTKDGRTILCEWFNTPLVDDLGTVMGVASLAQDITETRRVTEERDRILDLSVDMMAVIAQGGEIRRVNPAWERTLGYHDRELLGINVFTLVHPDDRGTAIREAMRTEQGEHVVDLRTRIVCADGSSRWISWNVTPLQNGLAYTVARDITAQVEAEQEQAELMAALEKNTVALAEQAAELDRLRIAAEHLANYDMLTGVRNRRAWFADAERTRHSAVAIFDIDHFKRINDTLGHPAGDGVLQSVAARLAAEIEHVGALGRIGGEEFAAVFHVPFHQARAACDAVIAAVSDHVITLPSGEEIHVTISGGLAPWRAGGRRVADALQATYEEADVALYQAKEAGRRRLVVRGPRAA